MAIKIGKNAKIGDQNAIGDNAKVTARKNIRSHEKQDSDKMWFSRHPWLSAFIVSGIVAFIALFDFVKKAAEWVENLF